LGGEEHNLKLALHVIHEAPQTTSNVIIKSALSDNAQVSIDGLVTIASGAKKSKAWLAAHLLLLSNKAKGRAVPSLEILENDIKAGHATTVGKIDEEALFYLMSRGLPRKRAKQLIVEGFLQDMINEMPPALAKRAKKNLPYHNILI
jgi:Fe-S cluster assembly protein SufD